MTLTEGYAGLIDALDRVGFSYGETRISLYRGLVVLFVVLAVLLVARLTSVGVRRVFRRITQLDSAQQLLGEKLVSIAVWVLAILIGIDVLAIDLTALAVFSGAFGLAVGFGLQKTFGNLIAGIILLMDRSIKPGDVIAVTSNGTSTVGEVKKIGIRAVSITTRDRIEYLIPNENLMINQVENWSYSSRDVRLKVPVTVSYDSDIALAERLMLEATRDVPRVLDRPAPTVWLHGFGENGVLFEIQIWINDPEEGTGNVRSDVLKRVWHVFRENAVRIPFPQREVRLAPPPAAGAKG